MSILDHSIRARSTLGTKNQSQETFHVGMAGTANYIPYLGIAIMSLKQANPDINFVFHLFVSNLPEVEKENLAAAADQIKCEVRLYVVNDDALKSFVNGMYTASFWYRFIMPDILYGQVERLLYLDGDIMCCGSIDQLRKISIENTLAAVVSDRDEERQKRQMQVQRFFNSGMMLINVEQWVKAKMLDQIICFSQNSLSMVDKHGRCKAWGNARYCDQNILNKVLDGKTVWLPKKYNYIYKLNRSALFRKPAYNDNYKEQVLLHFAGAVKPWHSWVQHWPVVQAYRTIWKNSPWNSMQPVSPRSTKALHAAAREYRVIGEYKKSLHFYLRYFLKKW